jgi:hypothetical protein
VEKLGAGRGRERVKAFPQSALKLIRSHGLAILRLDGLSVFAERPLYGESSDVAAMRGAQRLVETARVELNASLLGVFNRVGGILVIVAWIPFPVHRHAILRRHLGVTVRFRAVVGPRSSVPFRVPPGCD